MIRVMLNWHRIGEKKHYNKNLTIRPICIAPTASQSASQLNSMECKIHGEVGVGWFGGGGNVMIVQ